MESMQDIRRHINTIKTIQKETKAMKAVYAAKLNKTQTKLLAARPYADKLKEVLARLVAAYPDFDHELTEQKVSAKIGYVIFTGNRGMAGSYSADICHFGERLIKEKGQESQLIVVGKKGRDYFRKRGYTISQDFVGLGEEPDFEKAKELAKAVVRPFTEGEVGEVVLIYTPYLTAIRNQPFQETFLPLSRDVVAADQLDTQAEYLYEPGAKEILSSLLPSYLQMYIYKTMLEAKASEHAARTAAMGAASDNAEEIIEKLTLSYNRAHQAQITKEITEITKA